MDNNTRLNTLVSVSLAFIAELYMLKNNQFLS